MNDEQASATSKLTLANMLTGFRLVATPILLCLAWQGDGVAFMALLAAAFFSDLLDGFVARMTGQVSRFGAMLDSWADMFMYLTIAAGCWLLWPGMVLRERFYVALIVASCLLPAAAGLIKFGHFTSYHTWCVKAAAASMGISLYVLFFGGPVWPFHLATLICVLAACEEIAITLLIPETRSNLRSVWDVVKNQNSFGKNA